MNEEYFKQQSERVRAIAATADPFTKRRLLDLVEIYEAKLGGPSPATRALKPVLSAPPPVERGGGR